MFTRRRLLKLLAAGPALIPLSRPAAAQSKIPLAQIEDMFANMRAKTNWDVHGPLLWGYYFFDPSEVKLKALGKELSDLGYRLVEIGRVGGHDRFRLHVEKVEGHTAQTLDARNAQLFALAEKHAVETYEGVDVGLPPAATK